MEIATRTTSRRAEVRWGTSKETSILSEWIESETTYLDEAHIIKRSEDLLDHSHGDFDFVALDEFGVPVVYIEVKHRRIPWDDYRDVITPIRKHDLAKRLADRNIPFVIVTKYSCGALVECDLAQEPERSDYLARWDRAGKYVLHAYYDEDQVRVLW